MAAKVKRFKYEGPQAYISALDQTVEHGDEVYGPAALEVVHGFTVVGSGKGQVKGTDSKLVNERGPVEEAVSAGAAVGSGNQTEEDR
jgi:hypothetical protein